MESMQILIAEDEPIFQRQLSRTLNDWGHKVIVASNGQDAWKILQTDQIHFLITDWVMPQLDGLELCRLVRTAHKDSPVYIILLTSKTSKEDVVEGIEAGADDFVAKPFDEGELLARIRAGERVLELEKQLANTKWLEGIRQTAVTLQHEINNALVGIAGNAELMTILTRDSLQDFPSRDAAKLEVLAKEILRMSKHITSVLDELKKCEKPIVTYHPVGTNMAAEMVDTRMSK
jgi:DNA-binding response OmpR family regulator